MKKTLITLVLLFSLFGCERNYIKDFKIEGIGLGDSLLDKYTKEEILKNQNDYYPETQFVTSNFFSTDPNFEYEQISVSYKRDDKKFIVHLISGDIFYRKDKDIKNCYIKREEIIKKLSELLKITEWENDIYTDNLGSFDQKYIVLESGDYVYVGCSDYNKETENRGWVDNLSVEINSQEMEEMLRSNPKLN